jgi:hypothetical protein
LYTIAVAFQGERGKAERGGKREKGNDGRKRGMNIVLGCGI